MKGIPKLRGRGVMRGHTGRKTSGKHVARTRISVHKHHHRRFRGTAGRSIAATKNNHARAQRKAALNRATKT